MPELRPLWSLMQKCSGFIADNLSWKATHDSKEEAPLSNDQKFAKYEMKKAGVATQLETDVPNALDGQTDGVAQLKTMLHLLDGLIDGKVLEVCPVEDGKFKKLQAVAKLLDDGEDQLVRFVKPMDTDPLEATEQATGFNEFIESLLTLRSETATYKPHVHGDLNFEETLEITSQLQSTSHCLFETLVQNSSCCAEYGTYHIAKLRLISLLTLWDYSGTVISFDIFLCSRSDIDPRTWHRLSLNFELDHLNDCQFYPRENSRLCSLISHCKRRKQALKIHLANNKKNTADIINLHYFKSESDSDLPDVSLASLIDNRDLVGIFGGGSFTPSDKASLLLTIATSLLSLSRDSWLSSIWRAEEIYFPRFQNPSEDWITSIDRPYLSATLSSDVLPETENSSLELSNPCILSFALLMLEILAGKRMPTYGDMWSTVNGALEGEMRHYLTTDIKGIIDSCLSFELQVHAGIGKNIEEKTKDFIFRKIVRPLEADLKRWGNPKDGRREMKLGQSHRAEVQLSDPLPKRIALRPPEYTNSSSGSELDEFVSETCSVRSSSKLKLKKAFVRFEEEHQEIQYELPDSTPTEAVLMATLYDERDMPLDTRMEQLAKEFFRNVSRFNTSFIRRDAQKSKILPSWQQRTVRVAILDSGLKATDAFISGALAKHRIVEMRSWAGNNCDDTCGHGTHVTRLFLKVAPYAELYIAKISDGKEIPANQLPAIGKAIEHAINEWDVDIISLSLGLEELDPVIDAAIDMALKPKENNTQSQRERIIFAAAANGGAGKARAYPACKPGVICVNASDGNGGSVDWLNPAAVAREDNFATLGIHIESRWKRQDVYKSGTSFATPIAAAISANMLEFARFELEMNYLVKSWLYSSKGIKAILRRFSVDVGGYRFLCPWKGPEGRRLDREYLKSQLEEAFSVDYFR